MAEDADREEYVQVEVDVLQMRAKLQLASKILRSSRKGLVEFAERVKGMGLAGPGGPSPAFIAARKLEMDAAIDGVAQALLVAEAMIVRIEQHKKGDLLDGSTEKGSAKEGGGGE